MTKLAWDKVDDRKYETGIDRGVLYLESGKGVAWNGLTSVEEDDTPEISPLYIDGRKYMDLVIQSDYKAMLSAYTYPEEFLACEGVGELGEGLYADDQNFETFGLSYRTLSFVDGLSEASGYKIHIVYNLTSTPSDRSYESISQDPGLSDFSWEISGRPETYDRFSPTAHIVLDTTILNPYFVKEVEDILYGKEDVVDGKRPNGTADDVIDGGTVTVTSSDILDGGVPGSAETTPARTSSAPRLPSLNELANFAKAWRLISVVDNGDGTWTLTGPDEYVNMIGPDEFQVLNANATFINSDEYNLSDTVR